MLLIKIAALLILLLIFLQDILSRSVYWFLFPLLVLTLFVIRLQVQSLAVIAPLIGINLGFLTLQFLLLTVYFSLKNRKWVNITERLLGPGDLLSLGAISSYLSVLNYLFFYIASLLLVLSFWLIWQQLSRKKDSHIPLAGLQSLLFAVLLCAGWWLFPVRLVDDTWVLNLFTK